MFIMNERNQDVMTMLGLGMSEYIKMFALTEDELNMHILDYQAGTSSFTAEMCKQGKDVVACDALYQQTLTQITEQAAEAIDTLKQLFKKPSTEISILPDKEEVIINGTMHSAHHFLADFSEGIQKRRYVTDTSLKSFKDESFNLALVSHYLFTLGDQLSMAYHYDTIKELIRIANEVRIFPLVTKAGKVSPYIGEIVAKLQNESYDVEIRGVEYELQKQGNAMLRVWAPQCRL